jgi:hypothetical protein
MTQRKPPRNTAKRKTIIEETLPQGVQDDGEPTEFDVSLESVDDAEALKSVLNQFGETNVMLKIVRVNGEYCYRSETLDEEFIQKNFGGGEYNVRIFIDGQYKKTMPLKIASRLVSAHEGNGGASANGSDHHSQFLEKMLLSILGREKEPAPAVTPGPSLTDLTTALSNLDNLRGKQESGIDLVMKGIELSRRLEGKTDWKMELIGLAKDNLPQVMDTIQGLKGGIPAAGGGEPPAPGTETNVIPIEVIRQGIQYLKKKFDADIHPDLISEWIYNNAEEYRVFIGIILNKEFSDFAQYDPEILQEPYSTKFKRLFDGLRSAFAEQNKVDDDSGGNVGDTNHPGNDGNTGADGGSQPKGA